MNRRQKTFLAAVAAAALFLLAATTLVNLATQVTGILGKTNGGTGLNSTATFPSSGTVSVTFASGTTAMGTAAIASGACSTTVTVATTSIATSDTIPFSLNAAPTGTNMYSWLVVYSWPTSGNVNFAVCNPSAASRTPTAMSLVWHVYR